MKIITLITLSILVLSSCSDNKEQNFDVFDPRIYAKSYTSIFTSEDCSNFDGLTADATGDIECGTLTVPESRYDVENLSQVTLAVAILKSSSAAPKPPIIYLHGGPGGSSLGFTEMFADSIFKEAIIEQDIILVDQRGGGDSTPSLACPEITEFQIEKLQNITVATEAISELDFTPIIACKERLESDGIDLSAYTTIENASDINDLRLALNIDQWNLYGVSYGGALAQAIMRYYPEGVRSVILDSPSSIAHSILDITEVVKRYSLLNDILTECAQNIDCEQKYPNLEERFWNKVAQLNETPDRVNIKISSFDIDIERVPFDGEDFVEVINYLIDVNLGRAIPRVIAQILNENYRVPIVIFEEHLTFRNFSDGVLFSMTCADEKQRNYSDSHIDNTGLPDRFDTNKEIWRKSFDTYQKLCRNWPHSQTTGLTPEPLVSAIPTLLFGGKYDIRTPTETTKKIEESLSAAIYVEFADEGHGVFRSECSQLIRDEFIDSPYNTPDLTCITKIDSTLKFSKPGNKQKERRTYLPRFPF